MKAVQLIKYSKTHPKYRLAEIDEGKLGPEDIRVQVRTAGVNPVDYKISHGDIKLLLPYKLPLTMGNELVGTITEIGKQVPHGFKIGDRVFARMPIDRIGAFAESAVLKYSSVAKVPEYLTDEEAAAIPLTALTTLQALNLFNGKPGDSLFISGGTGSFGAMAIPIATALGYKVITSGSERNRPKVENLGISKFIDYHTTDYTEILHDIDFVIDTIGGKEIKKSLAILKPGGTVVSLNPPVNKEFAERMGVSEFQKILFTLDGLKIDHLAAKEGKNYRFIFVRSSGIQLALAAKILEQKQIHPAIGKVYTLDEYDQALTQVEQGHNSGKIIIKNTISPS
ncbi:NADP-dependent oxidoreductase [Lactobacillus sp.]|uniref:NADP-dependent oxidoreductase n=1 Tax=Lactobacillus sp. TaxID=1591 RepID=UPI0019A0097A|nr:NADP-dependent oxidoreductase [Lactobacillus sp.]MBD5429542.1 NADP-dependent oxidoreductase [Lactobacillus sp.]